MVWDQCCCSPSKGDASGKHLNVFAACPSSWTCSNTLLKKRMEINQWRTTLISVDLSQSLRYLQTRRRCTRKKGTVGFHAWSHRIKMCWCRILWIFKPAEFWSFPHPLNPAWAKLRSGQEGFLRPTEAARKQHMAPSSFRIAFSAQKSQFWLNWHWLFMLL